MQSLIYIIINEIYTSQIYETINYFIIFLNHVDVQNLTQIICMLDSYNSAIGSIKLYSIGSYCMLESDILMKWVKKTSNWVLRYQFLLDMNFVCVSVNIRMQYVLANNYRSVGLEGSFSLQKSLLRNIGHMWSTWQISSVFSIWTKLTQKTVPHRFLGSGVNLHYFQNNQQLHWKKLLNNRIVSI